MDPSLPRRHTLGPSGIRQELPRQQQQQHQHEDGVIMTGASLESAATDRAIITANLKKRTGRRNARPGDTKASGANAGRAPRGGSASASSRRRLSGGSSRGATGGDFGFSPYAPMMFNGGSSSVSPRPLAHASAPMLASGGGGGARVDVAKGGAGVGGGGKGGAKEGEGAGRGAGGAGGPTLEQCLVLPGGLSVLDGVLLPSSEALLPKALPEGLPVSEVLPGTLPEALPQPLQEPLLPEASLPEALPGELRGALSPEALPETLLPGELPEALLPEASPKGGASQGEGAGRGDGGSGGEGRRGGGLDDDRAIISIFDFDGAKVSKKTAFVVPASPFWQGCGWKPKKCSPRNRTTHTSTAHQHAAAVQQL
eukprot:jgi/Undpi1/3340/HiC_scaffold_15.g06713.m1